MKNAAKALLYQNKIPIDRVRELQAILAVFYELDLSPNGQENISDELLLNTVKMEIATRDEQFVPHGLKVVQTLDTPVSLVLFEVMWREHFVEEMQPRFLPIGWSTHHRIDRYSTMEME